MVSRTVGMNCDGMAAYYELLEKLSFGDHLARRRSAYLEKLAGAQRAVLCGDGDGRFLAELLCANERVEVDYVELSGKMVELARRRIAWLGPEFLARVRFIVGDVRTFEGRSGGYDLIVTHFFLDCFSEAELPAVVELVAKWRRPGAHWIVSDFHEEEAGIRRMWTRAVVRALYWGFWVLTGLSVTRLPNYKAALAATGALLCAEEARMGGLLHSSLWKFTAG
jgi:SAM-dependent methyltransferase